MDSADFEQLLWQPTVEDGDTSLEEHDIVVKAEPELDLSLVKGIQDIVNNVFGFTVRAISIANFSENVLMLYAFG